MSQYRIVEYKEIAKWSSDTVWKCDRDENAEIGLPFYAVEQKWGFWWFHVGKAGNEFQSFKYVYRTRDAAEQFIEDLLKEERNPRRTVKVTNNYGN